MCFQSMRQLGRPQMRAFTLIEILIVVVILGILASICVVALGSASVEARESVLRRQLQYMRSQISLYRSSHSWAPGIDPQTGQASGTLMAQQLTLYTDYYGNTANTRDSVYTFTPYLAEFPLNPFMSANSDQVKIVASGADLGAAVDETTGWIYQPDTLEFAANSFVYGPGTTGKKW